MIQKYTDQTIINWINNSQIIGDEILSDIFCIYLENTVKNNWTGACHDLSASFYMTLLEYGYKANIFIGIADLDGYKFDHSWVAINDNVYDFSVCVQNIKSSTPVFRSINLENLSKSNIIYGIQGVDLGEPAKTISSLTLDEYQKIRPKNQRCIYNIAAEFGSIIPSRSKIKLDEKILKDKYSEYRRSLVK